MDASHLYDHLSDIRICLVERGPVAPTHGEIYAYGVGSNPGFLLPCAFPDQHSFLSGALEGGARANCEFATAGDGNRCLLVCPQHPLIALHRKVYLT